MTDNVPSCMTINTLLLNPTAVIVTLLCTASAFSIIIGHTCLLFSALRHLVMHQIIAYGNELHNCNT